MNQNIPTDGATGVPWPTSDDRVRVPSTSMLPDSETPPSAAGPQALHAKTSQLRETGDAWAESARTAVRCNPLAAVAAAFALGVVIARIAR